jgi:hypothetical protein
MTERDVCDPALELPPEDSAAYLDGVCGGDAALRQRLEALLRQHDQAGAFLERPAVPGLVTAHEAPVRDGLGTVVGPYKLLQQIGDGGFGGDGGGRPFRGRRAGWGGVEDHAVLQN